MSALNSHTLKHVREPVHDLYVPVTEIAQEDSPGGIPNPPVAVYRTAGPGSDPVVGLPPLRAPWIAGRKDVEGYAGRGRELLDDGRTAARRGHASQEWKGARPIPLRARNGRTVTQMHYARAGIIT